MRQYEQLGVEYRVTAIVISLIYEKLYVI